jgi:hypothetical protein
MLLCLCTLSSSAHWVLSDPLHPERTQSVSWNNDQSRALSDEIASQLQKLLSDHSLTLEDIKKLYVFTGPGAFTGLRMGVAFALGLARAINKELIALPTHTLYPQKEFFIPTRHQLAKTLTPTEALEQNLEFISISQDGQISLQKPLTDSFILGLNNQAHWPFPQEIHQTLLRHAEDKEKFPLKIEYGLEPKISVSAPKSKIDPKKHSSP